MVWLKRVVGGLARLLGRVGASLLSQGGQLTVVVMVLMAVGWGFTLLSEREMARGEEPHFLFPVVVTMPPELGETRRLVMLRDLAEYGREHPEARLEIPEGEGRARLGSGVGIYRVTPLAGGGQEVEVSYHNLDTQRIGEFAYRVTEGGVIPLRSAPIFLDQMALAGVAGPLAGWLAVLLLGRLLMGLGGWGAPLDGRGALGRDPWVILMGRARVHWEGHTEPEELLLLLREAGLECSGGGGGRVGVQPVRTGVPSWWEMPRISGRFARHLGIKWIFQGTLRLVRASGAVQWLMVVVPGLALTQMGVLLALWQRAPATGEFFLQLALVCLAGGVLAFLLGLVVVRRVGNGGAALALEGAVMQAWAGRASEAGRAALARHGSRRRVVGVALLAWLDVLFLDAGVVAWGALVLGVPPLFWRALRAGGEQPVLRRRLWGMAVAGLVLASGALGLFYYNLELAQERGDRVAAAIHAFQEREGRYPETLEELVPLDLREVPPTKWNFALNRFRYVVRKGEAPPVLFYVKAGAFLRNVYDFETRRWEILD